MSIELVMFSSHLILWCPLLFLPSVFLNIRVFSKSSALCVRWPEYWSFSFSIGPSDEYSRLISFRMDWFDFLAVQGTLKSLQHHNSKASVLQCLSFLYGPALTSVHDYWKNHSFHYMNLCWQSDVDGSAFSHAVIAFLPRSKRLLIDEWLPSLSRVVLEPKKRRSVTASVFPPSIFHEVMGLDAMISVFWMLSFKPAFWLSSFTLIKRLFCSFSLSAIRMGRKDNKQCKQRVRHIIRMSLVEMPKQNIRDWLS